MALVVTSFQNKCCSALFDAESFEFDAGILVSVCKLSLFDTTTAGKHFSGTTDELLKHFSDTPPEEVVLDDNIGSSMLNCISGSSSRRIPSASVSPIVLFSIELPMLALETRLVPKKRQQIIFFLAKITAHSGPENLKSPGQKTREIK